jgi:hypothetical protein
MFGPTISLLPTSLVCWFDADPAALKPVAGVDALGKLELPVLELDKELVVLIGGFGVLDSRLPKSVSDRSMKSPENNCRDDVIKINEYAGSIGSTSRVTAFRLICFAWWQCDGRKLYFTQPTLGVPVVFKVHNCYIFIKNNFA